MTRKEFISCLKKHHACKPSMEWIAANPRLSPKKLWEKCPNVTWMLWLTDRHLQYSAEYREARWPVDIKYSSRYDAIQRFNYASGASRSAAHRRNLKWVLAAEADVYRQFVKWEDVEKMLRAS